MHRSRLIQISLFLGGLVLGATALAFAVAGELYEFRESLDGVHLPRVDAIVCLAGGRGRLSAAADLWQRYHEHAVHPVLYLAGVGPQSTWKTISTQFHRGVLENLRSESVYLETESQNTEENALYFARMAKGQGWKKVVLMTSPYHLRRAKRIFDVTLKEANVPMEIETYAIHQDPFDQEEWRGSLHGVRVTLTEYVKWVYYSRFWKN